MRIYRTTEELAKKFDADCPEELSAQLQWWAKTLGIDRVRLLRMIGMSARQAGARKGEALKEILKSPEWEANAQLVQGGLQRVLSHFPSAWQTFRGAITWPKNVPRA